MASPDPDPPSASLASGLLARAEGWAKSARVRARRGVLWLRARRIGWDGDWRVAVAVGALIAAGPVAGWIGAAWLAERASAEIARLEPLAAPRLAEAEAAARARTLLGEAVRRGGLGELVEAAAQALPGDASLVSVARDAAGEVTLEIATPDPDGLRGALRRSPALAGLRDAGQRRGGVGMVVTLTGVVE